MIINLFFVLTFFSSFLLSVSPSPISFKFHFSSIFVTPLMPKKFKICRKLTKSSHPKTTFRASFCVGSSGVSLKYSTSFE